MTISEHFNATTPPAANTNAPSAGYGMPMVVESGRGYDLVSRLMEDNIILVQGPINQGMAGVIVAQLLYLAHKQAGTGSKDPICMYIDSPGGSVDAGMAIYDAMNYVQAQYGIPISTVGIGMNMSMGSFLLSAGTPGHRKAMANTNHMVHQPSGGAQGTATTMNISNEHMKETKERMALLYMAHTKMTYEEVLALSDHGDSYLRAEECLRRGIVDRILYPDDIMAEARKRGVAYPPEVEAHMRKLSDIQRRMNQHHDTTREGQRTPPGMYSHLKAA